MLKIDAYAYSELMCITKNTPYYLVEQFVDKADVPFKAPAAWAALCNKYEQQSSARKMELKRQYTLATMGTADDPDDFMRELDHVRAQLRINGHDISDKDFLQDCVLKLPDKVYSELITKIEMELDSMTLSTYQDHVRAFYRRKVLQVGSNTSSSGTALLAADGRLTRINSSKQSSGSSNSTSSGSSNSSSSSRRNASTAGDFSGKCFFCNNAGHRKQDCRKYKAWLEQHGGERKGGRDNRRHDRRPGQGGGQQATIPGLVALSAIMEDESASGSNGWIVDNGATVHMTGTASGMANVRTSNKQIEGINGLTPVTHIGDLRVTLTSQQGISLHTTLHDVHVVPALGSKSLFSTDKAGQAGATFYDNYAQKTSYMAFAGYKVPFNRSSNGLRLLPLQRATDDDKTQQHGLTASTAAKASTLDINVFHARMGHINGADLHRLAKAADISLTGELGDCVGCALGKHRRHSIPKQTARSIVTPMEQLHTDFSGPVSVLTNSGRFSMFQVIIDAATRAGKVYLTKSKHSYVAAEGLQRFQQEIVGPMNATVKVIRSDGGGEFEGKEFKAACQQLGIKQEFTSAHTPQQNGIAEAFIRTIVQKGSSMLQHSKLDLSYWGFAIDTANYLYNRTPHSALNGITPWEACTGNRPNLQHISTFGSLCFVHVESNQRSKWAQRSRPGVLVGYSSNRADGCYSVYIPSTGRVVQSMHVDIHEQTLYADFVKGGNSAAGGPHLRLPPLSVLLGAEDAAGPGDAADNGDAADGDGDDSSQTSGDQDGMDGVEEPQAHDADAAAQGGAGGQQEAAADGGNVTTAEAVRRCSQHRCAHHTLSWRHIFRAAWQQNRSCHCTAAAAS